MASSSDTIQLAPIITVEPQSDNIRLTSEEHIPVDNSDERERQEEQHDHEFSLPPVDGGKDAWLFLAGSFVLEALVWGFPFSFGVFQDYYARSPIFSSHPSATSHSTSPTGGPAVIGTSASGIMYLSGPLVMFLLHRYPHSRKFSSISGLVILTAGLLGASFASTISGLIACQGVLYAVGGCFLYAPAIFYLDEWFVRRKGLAYGVMWAGTGTSGLIIPLVMNWGLERYGFRTMLRAWAGVMILMSAPLIWFVKPRLPLPVTGGGRKVNYGFVRMPTFWILQIANVVQGLGFFIPPLYLPSYARSIGSPPLTGPLLLSLFNTTSVLGQLALGFLNDRLHVTTVMLISTIGSTLSIFLLWGLSISLPPLLAFSLFYGFFAGGFTSCYSGTIKEVKRRDPGAEPGLVFGWLGFGRGVGNVVAGPMSEALLGIRVGPVRGLGYGTGYGGLIVFTGITAVLAGVGWMGRMLRLI